MSSLFVLTSARKLNIVICLSFVIKLLILKAEKTRYACYNVVTMLFYSFGNWFSVLHFRLSLGTRFLITTSYILSKSGVPVIYTYEIKFVIMLMPKVD
jgi:hypothetical protein